MEVMGCKKCKKLFCIHKRGNLLQGFLPKEKTEIHNVMHAENLVNSDSCAHMTKGAPQQKKEKGKVSM